MKFQKGFALIELMVAISILTIGIVAILYMFPLGTKISKTSQMATTAAELGQAKVEELISLPYDDVVSSTEDYGSIQSFPAFKRAAEVNYYDPQSKTIIGSDLGIKKITVTISWRTSFSFEKNIVLHTLIVAK